MVCLIKKRKKVIAEDGGRSGVETWQRSSVCVAVLWSSILLTRKVLPLLLTENGNKRQTSPTVSMASVANVPYILGPPHLPLHNNGDNNNVQFLCRHFLVHRNTGCVPSNFTVATSRSARSGKRSSSPVICSAANKPSSSSEIRFSLSVSSFSYCLYFFCI